MLEVDVDALGTHETRLFRPLSAFRRPTTTALAATKTLRSTRGDLRRSWLSRALSLLYHALASGGWFDGSAAAVCVAIVAVVVELTVKEQTVVAGP